VSTRVVRTVTYQTLSFIFVHFILFPDRLSLAVRGKATHTSCGKKLTFDELKEKTKETGIDYQDEPYIWKDAFGRGPVYEGYDPSASYGRYLPPGTVDERGRELAADRNPRKAKPTGYTWVPGDVPLIKGGGFLRTHACVSASISPARKAVSLLYLSIRVSASISPAKGRQRHFCICLYVLPCNEDVAHPQKRDEAS